MTFSEDLEQLLTACAFPFSDARDLPKAVRAVAATLLSEGITYAVAGRLALARFCRPQYTDLLQLRILKSDEDRQLEALLESVLGGSISSSSTVRLKATFVVDACERILIEQADDVPFLGSQAHLVTAEHLLWLAASSRDPDARVDAVRLLQAKALDHERLRALVSRTDGWTGMRMKRLVTAADRAAKSTYQGCVERRLLKAARRSEPFAHGE